MRLLAVLAVAVVIKPSQSQFLDKKKNHNKKRHKNTQPRDQRRNNDENSFQFPELEIDRFFNQEKVNYKVVLRKRSENDRKRLKMAEIGVKWSKSTF